MAHAETVVSNNRFSSEHPMAITIVPKVNTTTTSAPAEVSTPAPIPLAKVKKLNKGHSRPLDIQGIDLDTPQRLLMGHVLAYMKTSPSTLARWIEDKTFPAPDGRQGRRPFWFTSTIRPHVVASK